MFKDMQLNQAQLIKNMELNQTRLIVNHAHAINAMEVNHSNQMTTIQNKLLAMEEKQVQLINTMETNHAKEISVMKANHFTFQNRLEEMERLQAHKFQLISDHEWEKNKETDHKPPNLLNRASSYYDEVIFH